MKKNLSKELDNQVGGQPGVFPSGTQRGSLRKHSKLAQSAWDTALKFLSVSGKSEYELENKLKEKGFSESEINDVLEKAKKFKFIDDEAYALAIAQKEFSKLRGPLRIKETLNQRGISPELAERTLRTLGAHEPRVQCDIAQKSLEAKFGRKAFSKATSYRYLISQGFSDEIAHSILKIEGE